jgi:hypothetical protein
MSDSKFITGNKEWFEADVVGAYLEEHPWYACPNCRRLVKSLKIVRIAYGPFYNVIDINGDKVTHQVTWGCKHCMGVNEGK